MRFHLTRSGNIGASYHVPCEGREGRNPEDQLEDLE